MTDLTLAVESVVQDRQAGRTAAAVWSGGMGDARVTLARIQSDLERVASRKDRSGIC
ncbi:MAG: hypothetical protein VB101_09430 [Rhodospirillaceae bacterium]|nr:hypothetical protein [Rhodospirillaceae bacterium]